MSQLSVFAAERQRSGVCPKALKRMVFRNEDIWQNIQAISALLKKVAPAEEVARFHELSRPDQIRYAYKVLGELVRNGVMDTSKPLNLELFYLTPFELPSGVSILMVRPLIDTLCSEEQKAKWLPLFDSSRVVGAYAQTELGHGSDVQSLETEAVFDERRREFVLHSPTTSSLKWWPGELANIASVAIVYAKTVVKGRKIGVLPFIVPIRDFHTHQPLPGVEVGDIGPKMGYGAKENGFLRLDHVRVPLANMPSRFVEVTPEGNVVQKGNPKIVYSSMMKSRTALLGASAYYLGKATAIAVRYSFLRRQFKNDQKQEIPVIQYQLQRFKLLPLLAKAYVMQGAFIRILDLVATCDAEVKAGKFDNLQETHVILSGAKAFFTWWCMAGLNVTMQCCGGHGYSHYSGIPNLIQNFAPNTILEGENTMLLLQVGRHLLKNFRYVSEGRLDKLHGYCTFLQHADALTAFNARFDADVTCLDQMRQLWQKAVAAKVAETAEAALEHSANHSLLDTFNKKIGIHVFEAAKLHSILFTFDFFVQFARSLSPGPTRDAMLRLARLFAADLTLECAGILVPLGVISADQIKTLQKSLEGLLEELFPDALVLAEGFIVDDYSLHSAIASDNEKPYENLYALAKAAGVINQTDLVEPYLRLVRQASLDAFGKPKL